LAAQAHHSYNRPPYERLASNHLERVTMKMARMAVAIAMLGLVAAAFAETRPPRGKPAGTSAPQLPPLPAKVVELAFDAAAGLGAGWKDLGWAPRELSRGAPAKLDFADSGGWILARPGLSGSFGALLIRYKAPPDFGDFLDVAVNARGPGPFPRVTLSVDHRRDVDGGWSESLVPMSALNPRGLPFEQLVLRARKAVGHASVLFERIALTAGPAGATTGTATAPPGAAAAEPPLQAQAGRPAHFVLDCSASGRTINPLIYGTGGGDKSGYHWAMGPSAHRWGGNPSTRYNWQVGNAWNTGSDWFFRNVDYNNDPTFNYDRELEGNLTHGIRTALTVPMIGWVAKDTRSYSFPVSVFGPQQAVAPEDPDVGNGKAKNGTPLVPGPQSRTSVAAPPAFIARWLETIREKDKKRGQSVQMVILDNEPMLWHVTHRDIHPDPVSYDELLERSVTYATAIRKAYPEVLIAGPAEWGWTSYFYSAVDAVAGFWRSPDRHAHGNTPLIPWYLANMRARERKLGIKLLDVLDVHYYPAAGNSEIGVEASGSTDAKTNALRLRSTRSLWDPSYMDESWIKDRVALIPRLRRWVDEYAPGLGISLGEYSFGGANHQSGGLAQAEALGRFGTEGLTAAFYWRLPPKDSPAFWAFRAYRNFDGEGGKFLDISVPVVDVRGERASLFGSRSPSSDHVVAVLLNLDPDQPLSAEIDLSKCGGGFSERAFSYTGGTAGFTRATPSTGTGAVIRRSAPPYSITVLDFKAAAAAH
jgi:hypothetical protein